MSVNHYILVVTDSLYTYPRFVNFPVLIKIVHLSNAPWMKYMPMHVLERWFCHISAPVSFMQCFISLPGMFVKVGASRLHLPPFKLCPFLLLLLNKKKTRCWWNKFHNYRRSDWLLLLPRSSDESTVVIAPGK